MRFKFGILLVLVAVFLFGCFKTTSKLSGFGQCVAAGNPIMESLPRQCAMNGTTYVEEICTGLGLDTALQIAAASECGDRMIVDKRYYSCNNYSNTWWISLDINKPGCMPACVVNADNMSAYINWRCTGSKD